MASKIGSVEQLSTSILMTVAAEFDPVIMTEKSGLIFVSLTDREEDDLRRSPNLNVELRGISNFIARSQEGCLTTQIGIYGD